MKAVNILQFSHTLQMQTHHKNSEYFTRNRLKLGIQMWCHKMLRTHKSPTNKANEITHQMFNVKGNSHKLLPKM